MLQYHSITMLMAASEPDWHRDTEARHRGFEAGDDRRAWFIAQQYLSSLDELCERHEICARKRDRSALGTDKRTLTFESK
jgi:hypothetical protein